MTSTTNNILFLWERELDIASSVSSCPVREVSSRNLVFSSSIFVEHSAENADKL